MENLSFQWKFSSQNEGSCCHSSESTDNTEHFFGITDMYILLVNHFEQIAKNSRSLPLWPKLLLHQMNNKKHFLNAWHRALSDLLCTNFVPALTSPDLADTTVVIHSDEHREYYSVVFSMLIWRNQDRFSNSEKTQRQSGSCFSTKTNFTKIFHHFFTFVFLFHINLKINLRSLLI